MRQNLRKELERLRLLLPPVEDYLGQWLLILQEHYRHGAQPSPTEFIPYRIALGKLNPQQMDKAFSQAFERHKSGFRPTAGEILEYWRDTATGNVQSENFAQLEGAPIDEAARKELSAALDELRKKLTLPPSPCVVRIGNEERKLAEEKAREAIRLFGGFGRS